MSLENCLCCHFMENSSSLVPLALQVSPHVLHASQNSEANLFLRTTAHLPYTNAQRNFLFSMGLLYCRPWHYSMQLFALFSFFLGQHLKILRDCSQPVSQSLLQKVLWGNIECQELNPYFPHTKYMLYSFEIFLQTSLIIN